MQRLCSRRARRGDHFCTPLPTEKPQCSRGEEGTLHALSRGGGKELCQESEEGRSEVQAWESWTRAREEGGHTRPGGHRPFYPGVAWQERSSGRCHGCHRSTARAGASVRREEERERATSLEFPRSCGLGSQGCCTATIISRPHHGRGENPPRSRHPTPPLADGDVGGCDRDGRRAGRPVLSAALPLLTARAAASFLADRSADGSQGLLRGLRWVTGNR